MEATRRRYGLDETFAVALPQINVFLPRPFRIPDTTLIYHNALSEIYWLGLCEGFTPALEDVVWFETEIRTHQISLENLPWFESKFSKTSKMYQKLENWRRYVEGLGHTNSGRVAIERKKRERRGGKGSARMPRRWRDFCQKHGVNGPNNH